MNYTEVREANDLLSKRNTCIVRLQLISENEYKNHISITYGTKIDEHLYDTDKLKQFIINSIISKKIEYEKRLDELNVKYDER